MSSAAGSSSFDFFLLSMVHTCAVGCKNRAGRCSASFCRFPANQEQREKWRATVRREGWQPSPSTRLGSDHFAKGKFNAIFFYTEVSSSKEFALI